MLGKAVGNLIPVLTAIAFGCLNFPRRDGEGQPSGTLHSTHTLYNIGLLREQI